jgi:hypothetical protein
MQSADARVLSRASVPPIRYHIIGFTHAKRCAPDGVENGSDVDLGKFQRDIAQLGQALELLRPVRRSREPII